MAAIRPLFRNPHLLQRDDQTRVDVAMARLFVVVDGAAVIGFAVGSGFTLCGGGDGVALEAAEGDIVHQRLVGAAIKDNEPDGGGDEREDEDSAQDGNAEGENAGHGDLEHNKADDDAHADDGPGFAGGVLAVVHGVEELVFVREAADHEVDEAEEQHPPGRRENAVYGADDENKNGLRKVEAIAEHRRLHQFHVVYACD